MKKITARILSFVFHPLLVPTYFLLMLFQMDHTSVGETSLKFRMLILGFVFGVTFLLPVLFSLLLWSVKLLKTIQMQSRGERMIPMVGIAVFFFFAFYSMKQLPVFPYFKFFLMGSAVLVLLAIVINYFWKISLHLMAWGGFTAVLTGMSLQLHQALYFWLFIVIFISGITGFARLQCKAHTHAQVSIGFLLGFAVMLSLLLTI